MNQPAYRRFADWIYPRLGGQALLRVIPLCLAMVCIGVGLSVIVADLPVDWLYSTTCLGVLAGWLMARGKRSGWWAALAVTGIGLVWLLLTMGQVGTYLLELLSTYFAMLWRFVARGPADLVPAQQAWSDLYRSLTALAGQLAAWFGGAFAGKPAADPVVTGLLWGLALWLTAGWAAWWVRRRNTVVVGMIPGMTLLGYNIFYTNSAKGIAWLGLAGGAWLVLQAIHSYLITRRGWQERRLDQAEIEQQLATAVSVVVIGFVLAGIFLPAFSFKKFSDSVQELFHVESDRSLAESLGLQQTPQESGEASGGGSLVLAPIHTVGAGPHLSQDIVLLVSVEGYTPPPPSIVEDYITLPEPAPRYYWRAQTYELYDGRNWTTQAGTVQEFTAGSPLQAGLAGSSGSDRRVVQHVTRTLHLAGTLFVAGELIQADQPGTALWRTPGDLIDARTPSDSYTADSRLPDVSDAQLRAAGLDYPDPVRSRYLFLPEELPQRVRDLALRLTANAPTPYDKAVTLQDYLRQFPYTLDVPAPPAGRDAADFFLFDLQKGYCDYYATAMVVMTRLNGIPARLVVGYANGVYDYGNSRFTVRQANAHAWVEIYFPGIGWVEFEPTAGQPVIARRGATAGQNAGQVAVPTPVAVANPAARPFDWSQVRHPLVVAESILIVLLTLLLLPLENWLLYLLPAGQAVTVIYRRLYRQGEALGVKAGLARTPHEFVAALSSRLELLAKNKRRSPLPALLPNLERLTGLYARQFYSAHPPTPAEGHQAIRLWGRLRRGLRRMGR